jgi:DNA-binding MarR family transcriptional regulator
MSKDLAVTLFDLAWLLPRTVGAADDAGEALPLSELEVMRLLVRHPGLSVNDVAAELGLRPSNVSAAVRSLAERGLIERRRDEGDARIARLHPTAEAIARRDRREAAWGAELERLLRALPEGERHRLLGATPALDALAQILRELHTAD